ncbi:MAG: 8-oxo-dGTP diphosphatase [Butyrivibrio sp.]|nr:8-oxo-dGTP diphosphatase [Butyrivibrio sp.]
MARREGLTTLCYLERDDQYLMMHRVSKKNDINKDKWIGVGGHLEDEESPEECIKREVFEETGFSIPTEDFAFRALVTFVSDRGDYELMSLFTAKCPEGDPADCDEGKLEWVKKSDIYSLNLWPGDKIFFRLMEEREDFFSLKLAYDKEDNLRQVMLDGKEIENYEVLLD